MADGDTETKTDDTPKQEGDKDNAPSKEDDTPIATTPLLEATRKERILLEEANKTKEELLNREEKIAANSMLGGTTGGHVEVKPKEETPKEYNARIEKEIGEGLHND